MIKNNKKILVIGAGFGGIASALRMRALGYDVTLIDRLSAIGGRAQVFNRGGFKHDAGPTVITAPFLFDELFELFLYLCLQLKVCNQIVHQYESKTYTKDQEL